MAAPYAVAQPEDAPSFRENTRHTGIGLTRILHLQGNVAAPASRVALGTDGAMDVGPSTMVLAPLELA
jgi:hypothetical protein